MPDPNQQQQLLERRPCPCICFAPVGLYLVNVRLQGESDQLTMLMAITFGVVFLLQRRQWKRGRQCQPLSEIASNWVGWIMPIENLHCCFPHCFRQNKG